MQSYRRLAQLASAVTAFVLVASTAPATGEGCGNGIVDPPEDCDDGGICIGGSNAGTVCSAESQCLGNGVCVGGTKVGYSCGVDGDCPEGTCVRCRTFGGDGCAANCTSEIEVDDVLVHGMTMGSGIKAGTSGVVVHGDALTFPAALTGDPKLTVGKASADGTVPFVVTALEQFVMPPVSTLVWERSSRAASAAPWCVCLRRVALRTCGGVLFNQDGTEATSCTEGFQGQMECPSDLPCTFVHGKNNSASGTLACSDAGLDGVDLSLTQDSGGSSGTPDKLQVGMSGHGPSGSARLLYSIAIGMVAGSCSAFPEFCTDADPLSERGQVQTVLFTTGRACAEVMNANLQNGSNIGPFCTAGTPADCTMLMQQPPSASGFGIVTAFPVPNQPTLGDVVITSQFFTLVFPPRPTPTNTVGPTSAASGQGGCTVAGVADHRHSGTALLFIPIALWSLRRPWRTGQHRNEVADRLGAARSARAHFNTSWQMFGASTTRRAP